MSLHLYYGPMFSGKTWKLIQEYNKYKVLGKRIMVINHSSDSRYSNENEVVSHNQFTIEASKLDKLSDADTRDVDVILIDEGQFFSDLYSFCSNAVSDGFVVAVFSLDGTFDQKPFGQILQLIPLADTAHKLVAYCKDCKDGTLAPFTKRKIDNLDQVLIGNTDVYEAVCRRHLNLHN